jgi:peptidyl-prolyl cis-trans isomerase SurA
MIKILKYSTLACLAVFASASAALSQETQIRVVDEVVAQVNGNVINLSAVRREMKNAIQSLVQDGKKPEEARALVEGKQAELIANLINEQLLMDKAKDLGLDSEIDNMVNQKLADIMKQIGAKTVDAVYTEMERQGVKPDEVKENWRRELVKQQVIQRDVQAKLYWSFSDKELHDYYDKHKDQFTKPETVSFSELFLGFAGRDEAAVRQKSSDLYKVLKAGGDWAKIVKENGDPGAITQGTGKVEKAKINDLPTLVRPALAGIKAGDYTGPFEIKDIGIVILKVDEREDASSESVFNESAVRLALMTERFPDQQKKYMAKLHRDGFIEINRDYKPLVSPALYADERSENTTTEKSEKPADAAAKGTKSSKDGAAPESSSRKKSSKKDDKSN